MTDNRNFNLGVLLMILGGFVLLANIGILSLPGLVFAAVLAAGGGYLSRVYIQNRGREWAPVALVFGFALFGTAAAALSPTLAGAQFLALLGGGFAVAYLDNRRHWWAVIPAGALFSLALVAGLGEVAPRLDGGPVLFFGLAATFAYLYKLPEGGKPWAVYPAIAAVAVALLGLSFTNGWLLPTLLIGGGAYLFMRRRGQSAPEPKTRDAVTVAPAPGTASHVDTQEVRDVESDLEAVSTGEGGLEPKPHKPNGPLAR